MQVFVLSHNTPYDGGDTLGVFDSAEKAIKSPEAEEALPKSKRRGWEPTTNGEITCSPFRSEPGEGLYITPYEVQ
jgi:hypothetical protein